MTEETENSITSNNRRDHLANERTFLAWIRTSIGIMAFGFVVEKFGLFIKEMANFLPPQSLPKVQDFSSEHATYSSLFGISLIILGVLIVLFSYINYRKVEKQIEENSYHSSMLPAIMTFLVLILGIFLVVYLINT